MSMTVSEALKRVAKLVQTKGESFEDAQAWDVLRTHIERGKDVLTTPGEVDAWFGGFAACEKAEREVDDAMAIRASNKFGQQRKRGVRQFDAMKAALVAALGDSHDRPR